MSSARSAPLKIAHRFRHTPRGINVRPMTPNVAASEATGAEGWENPRHGARISTNGRGRPIASAIAPTMISTRTTTMIAPKKWRQRLKKMRAINITQRSGRKNHTEPMAWMPSMTAVSESVRCLANH